MKPITDHPLYRNHTIDGAMSSLWEFYIRKFIILFPVSFVMGLIIQYLSSQIKIDLVDYQSFNIEEMMIQLREYMWPMVIISVLSLLFNVILQHYIIFSPLDDRNTIISSLLKSTRYFIPYLLIIIILAFAGSFALFLGLLLVIIGVVFALVYIITIYLFILPVMMIEGPDIANTIGRAIKLAHKDFWSNLGWTAVFIIILLVVTTLLSGLLLLPFTGSFLSSVTDPESAVTAMEFTSNPFYIILSAILNALTMPLLPVFACILYFKSRTREDGPAFNDNREGDQDIKVRIEDLYAPPLPENNTLESGNEFNK
jgi:MFS family permease